MAQSCRAKVAAADKALSKAQWAVFAFGEHDNVPWSVCFQRATPEVKLAYEAARTRRTEAEQEAIDKGRAWRSDNSGLLFWN